MRFALTSDHKEFFIKNGFIEFEDLLDAQAVAQLQQAIQATLCSRLKITSSSLLEQSPKTVFEAGFDLWRDNAVIKKILFKSTLSDIAGQLFQLPLLRIAFDQYLDTSSGSEGWLNTPLSMNELSCAHPLAGALFILLSTPFSTEEPVCPIASKAGNGIFVSADKAIAWKEIFSRKGLEVVILAYGAKKTFYRLTQNDSHTHVWKRLGYVFGDLLKDNLHPIVFRN